MPKITWTGILAFEGVSTNEMGSLGGRFIDPHALEWDTPIPLRIVMEDVGEHKGAITVGSIDHIERVEVGDGTFEIRGRGRFDAGSPIGLEAARLAAEQFKRSISIDPGNADQELRLLDADDNPLDPRDFESEEDLPSGAHLQKAITSGRIRGATITDITAFEGAVIEGVEIEDDEDGEPDDMVAAAKAHDGAMVALVPSEQDATRLAVDGFEPPEILHLTLAFLGDSESITPDTRDTIESVVRESKLAGRGPVTGSAWASANFNPIEEPAATYLVGGEDMNEVRDLAMSILIDAGFDVPEQHAPWIPHVTVGYGDLDASSLGQFGDVTFDRLRIAFGADDIRDIPLANGQAEQEVDESEDSMEPDDTIVAAAVPPHSTPVAPKESDWDGNTAEKALPTGEEPAFYRGFYAFQAPDTDGTAKDHWHYIHHHVSGAGSDAEVGAASLEAAHAIIGLLNGARGVNPVATGEDRKTVYDHLAKHMRDGGEEPPPLKAVSEVTTASAAPAAPKEEPTMPEPESATPPTALLDPDCDLEELTSLTASAVDIPTLPSSHFDPIDFAAPTPLTVDESTGHVYGHVAMSSICHVGYPKCVTMPKSASSLRYFHTGVVRLDDGSDLATGRITVHGAHASLDKDWRSAMAHYDNASTTVADVVAYEDDHGIAVTGHIRPGTAPELVHAFRGSTPSGDWRRIGPAAELINIHMVNSPGFPVYRTEGDRLEATITASATPARFTDDPPPSAQIASIAAEYGDEIAARVVTILNAQAEAEQLANEVHAHYELLADNLSKAVHR